MSIRTTYREITFRSRLEAQWAIVFDLLKIPWAYEPSRFELPSGVYVPDFLLYPDDEGQATWAEVKGPWPDAREFQVASEINLYVAPLMILTGDLPRRGGGGTAWWFSRETARWSMVSPREALSRTVYDGVHQCKEPEDTVWDEALSSARGAFTERRPKPGEGLL